jgi:hypothetical protein
MPNNRAIWLIVLSGVVFSGAALVTLHAAEQAARQPVPASARGPAVPPTAAPATPAHPAPSAPEESATIADDPTTAPDPSQSADNNVSFPTDI